MVSVSETDDAIRRLADIAVFDRDGRLQLIVEVKNRPEASAEWAGRLLHNMYAHSFLPLTPFFLLALPDHFYLWIKAQGTDDLVFPDYAIDPTLILSSYADKANGTGFSEGAFAPEHRPLSSAGLEMIVTSWLTIITASDFDRDPVPLDLSWLIDSGVYQAIKGGTVRTDVRV